LRSLSHFDGFVDFYSNDYLGSARFVRGGQSMSGSTGSRLISGNSQVIESSEANLADFFGTESGLMFNSGYDANLGLFSSVPQRGDTVVYDEFIHASIRDGIRLSLANSISFKHNNLEDLTSKISRAKGVVYVAIEGLYSMDGDLAPVKEIVDLCKRTNAYLIIDEAHSAGIFGENGRGLMMMGNHSPNVLAKVVTFGKAYGSHGAIVLGSSKLSQYLVNYSRPFIYTTAAPEDLYVLNSTLPQSSRLLLEREKLNSNIQYFRSKIKSKILISDPKSPIQIYQLGNIGKVKLMAENLQFNRIAVKPIFSPTVPEGKERIRICLHSYNSTDEIDLISEILNEQL
jgi:8-amino-7-oxononanoate synthase